MRDQGIEKRGVLNSGVPMTRTHLIPDLGDPYKWGDRKESTEKYFNDLRDDAANINNSAPPYTVPIAGDLMVAAVGGEIWIYRVSRKTELVAGHYYDENGQTVVSHDPFAFEFELTRGGELKTFIARLIQFRESFWGIIDGEVGEGAYTFFEGAQNEGNWVGAPVGVSGTAIEKSGVTELETGVAYLITKTFHEDHWSYVFSSAEGGGGAEDFYAQIVGYNQVSATHAISPVTKNNSGDWIGTGASTVFGFEQSMLVGLPLGTVVHVYKSFYFEFPGISGTWYMFELLHDQESGRKELLPTDGSMDTEEWNLSASNWVDVVTDHGCKFYITRVAGSSVYRREVEVDIAGHIHAVGPEELAGSVSTGGSETPWGLYLENYGTEEDPEWHIIYPFGSDLYQWGGGAQQNVPYTKNAVSLDGQPDGDYSVQLKITTDSTGVVVTSASTELFPGVSAQAPVVTDYIATTTYVVVSTITISGDDATIANHMSGRALGCLPVLTGGLVGMGVL